MLLTEQQRRILDGKEGELLQQAMIGLVKYGTAMGAEEFVPCSSAHIYFMSIREVAQYFPPRGVQLTEEDVARFSEKLARIQVRTKTTINYAACDLTKWRQMGISKVTADLTRQTQELVTRCGMLATFSDLPYLEDNIPVMGEHCSWSESSALIYCNSILGARTNPDGFEASFYSALLGITPNFGMHLDQNRKGTHLIDVQCEVNTTSDWGVLGYFAGEAVGVGVPVFINLKRPTVEEAKQLGASINVPGGIAMFHIVGVTPEALTIEAAFGENEPRGTYVFDESAKRKVYDYLNYEPEGKVDMVFLGCPHSTLYEVKEISKLIEGKHVAKGTRLWVMTIPSVRASAERLGYAKIIEDSGGELLAGGCLLIWYDYNIAGKPKLGRMVTNSVKQGYGVRRSFGSKLFVGDTERCIQIAIEGGV